MRGSKGKPHPWRRLAHPKKQPVAIFKGFEKMPPKTQMAIVEMAKAVAKMNENAK